MSENSECSMCYILDGEGQNDGRATLLPSDVSCIPTDHSEPAEPAGAACLERFMSSLPCSVSFQCCY